MSPTLYSVSFFRMIHLDPRTLTVHRGETKGVGVRMEPYVPHDLPLKNLDFRLLLSHIGDARAALGKYDGLLHGIVNPIVMLSPLTTEEAVLSSKIEGTQVTVDEVLEQEAGMIKEGGKFHDIHEVLNYRRALLEAQRVLEEQGITRYLLRSLHKILMSSVRGEDKEPGEFRKEQNWIGHFGCTMEQATFVPPDPLQLPNYLERWEAYVAGEDCDPLVQASIMHAQFELLHPFKDGNGRIGRLLIPIFLFQKKLLAKPMFYLSAYLEANRAEYYYRLRKISENDDWNGWIVFFLKAVTEQADTCGERVNRIIQLYNDMKRRIQELTHSQYVIQILDFMFDRPIFQASSIAPMTGIKKPTVDPLLRVLKEEGILKTIREAKGRKSAVLAFPALLNIAEGRKVF